MLLRAAGGRDDAWQASRPAFARERSRSTRRSARTRARARANPAQAAQYSAQATLIAWAGIRPRRRAAPLIAYFDTSALDQAHLRRAGIRPRQRALGPSWPCRIQSAHIPRGTCCGSISRRSSRLSDQRRRPRTRHRHVGSRSGRRSRRLWLRGCSRLALTPGITVPTSIKHGEFGTTCEPHRCPGSAT